MKLDSRVVEGKRPLTCFDVEEAKKYIGKDCYFASKLESFENLSKVLHATLHNVDDSHVPFQCYGEDGVLCYDRFILPCEWVKPETKYRPFTGIEFAEKFNLKLNSVIHLRTVPANDKCCYNYKVVFAGYRWDNNDVFEVFLNGWWVGLQDLLRRYEYEENGEWHKFGVEE